MNVGQRGDSDYRSQLCEERRVIGFSDSAIAQKFYRLSFFVNTGAERLAQCTRHRVVRGQTLYQTVFGVLDGKGYRHHYWHRQ